MKSKTVVDIFVLACVLAPWALLLFLFELRPLEVVSFILMAIGTFVLGLTYGCRNGTRSTK